jgi:hypothetical protein
MPPAWILLPVKENASSATALRQRMTAGIL